MRDAIFIGSLPPFVNTTAPAIEIDLGREEFVLAFYGVKTWNISGTVSCSAVGHETLAQTINIDFPAITDATFFAAEAGGVPAASTNELSIRYSNGAIIDQTKDNASYSGTLFANCHPQFEPLTPPSGNHEYTCGVVFNGQQNVDIGHDFLIWDLQSAGENTATLPAFSVTLGLVVELAFIPSMGDPPTIVGTSSGSVVLTPKEYWTYNDSHGNPKYNSTTGGPA